MEVLGLYNSESLPTINLSHYLSTYHLFLPLIIFFWRTLANMPALTLWFFLCVLSNFSIVNRIIYWWLIMLHWIVNLSRIIFCYLALHLEFKDNKKFQSNKILNSSSLIRKSKNCFKVFISHLWKLKTSFIIIYI